MFEKVLGLVKRKADLPEELNYEDARGILEQQNRKAKEVLAVREDLEPEILYYLATDESPDIRRRIAGNPATPHHADRILAADNDDEVRCELARKISRLLPDLDPEGQTALMNRTIEVLELLARDQLSRVRQILAEELKSTDKAPHKLINNLAKDNVIEVCAPILEYSPLLTDDDLREIISFSEVKGALAAIARRGHVSEDIADAIASSLDVPAVSALLTNRNAQIREETLDAIIDSAADVDEWHEPLVLRPNLSIRLMRRIASFVASSLVQVMIEQNDLGAGDGAALLGRVRERLEGDPIDAEEQESVAETVAELHARGAIDDAFMIHAIKKRQREVVIHALSLLADVHLDDVRDMMKIGHAHRLTALAWQAGLCMRTAFAIQKDVANIPPKKLINARDGFDYPFSELQMDTLLEASRRRDGSRGR